MSGGGVGVVDSAMRFMGSAALVKVSALTQRRPGGTRLWSTETTFIEELTLTE